MSMCGVMEYTDPCYDLKSPTLVAENWHFIKQIHKITLEMLWHEGKKKCSKTRHTAIIIIITGIRLWHIIIFLSVNKRSCCYKPKLPGRNIRCKEAVSRISQIFSQLFIQSLKHIHVLLNLKLMSALKWSCANINAIHTHYCEGGNHIIHKSVWNSVSLNINIFNTIKFNISLSTLFNSAA